MGLNDCAAADDQNAGCQAGFTDNTFGQGLNNVGGGYYAITRNDQDGISMFFWERNDPSVPDAVANGASSLTPDSSWGEPQGYFPTTQCDFSSHFAAHNIIFDLSFCVRRGFLNMRIMLTNNHCRDRGVDQLSRASAVVIKIATVVSVIPTQLSVRRLTTG